MSNHITLKAKFLGAFKAIVRVFPAQNTIQTLSFIRAIALHVSELLAIATFNRGIFISEISSDLIFQFIKFVFIIIFRFYFGIKLRFNRLLRHFTFFSRFFIVDINSNLCCDLLFFEILISG